MSYLRKRAGILVLAASMLAGVSVPLTASPAAAADPLAGSAGPSPLYPHTSTDSWQAVPPPGMDAQTFMRHPVLSWQRITSLPVTRYRVQLSPNADWTNNAVSLPNGGLTTATQYELPTTLPHASYFWRVRGEDADGHHTGWSGAADDSSQWQFTRTWAERPVTAAVGNLPDSSVQFRWSPMPDASSYEVQLSNDPLFPEGVKDPVFTFTCFTNHTTFSIARGNGDTGMEGDCGDFDKMLKDMGAGGPFYWHVRGIDGTTAAAVPTETSAPCRTTGADCSGWSTPVRQFTLPDISADASGMTANLDVDCPATVSGGQSIPLCYDTPTMSWDAVSGADAYVVDVSVDPMFTVLYRSYGVFYGHSLTPRDSYLDNQSGQSYYWRVTPCDYSIDQKVFYNCQNTDEQAPVAQFHKRSLPLPLAPASGSASTDGHDGLYTTIDNAETFPNRTAQVRVDQLTFHWDDYLGYTQQANVQSTQEAKQYRVQYADNADFDGAVSIIRDSTRWTPSPKLPDGTYYWRVQAIDGSGNHLTWSATKAFVKGTVPPVARFNGTGYLNPAQKVEIDFSSPVAGVSSDTLGVADAVTGAHLRGTLTVADAGTVYFTPSSPLLPGQRLRLWVTSAVRDLAGNPAEPSATEARVNPTIDSSSSMVGQHWAEVRTTHALGGGYATSASAGDRLTFPVGGGTVRLYGTRTPSGGYADVLLDGVRKTTVSCYASSTRWHALLLSLTVPAGKHTLAVVVRGTRPAGSHGRAVNVDAVQVGSTYLQERSSGTHQYWSAHRATDAYSGSYLAESGFTSGTTSAPALTARFSGSRLRVYGCLSPDAGYLAVYVDGSYRGKTDLYQSYSSCNTRVVNLVLSPGSHRVTLRAVGAHRSGSSGTRVSVDRLVSSDS